MTPPQGVRHAAPPQGAMGGTCRSASIRLGEVRRREALAGPRSPRYGPVPDGSGHLRDERVDQPVGRGLRYGGHRHPGCHHPLCAGHGRFHAHRRPARGHPGPTPHVPYGDGRVRGRVGRDRRGAHAVGPHPGLVRHRRARGGHGAAGHGGAGRPVVPRTGPGRRLRGHRRARRRRDRGRPAAGRLDDDLSHLAAGLRR